MIRKLTTIKPTPRDFSEFVYCGLNWILDKNDKNKNSKKLTAQSYDMSEQTMTLKRGQHNEEKCIRWILRNYRSYTQQIIFDGTGADNKNYLISTLDSLGIKMRCKPDLIFTTNNKNELYEFKAVKNKSYLYMPEFESNHAQIWCYTKIKEVHIDNYFLLRYAEDPFVTYPSIKEISYSENEDLHFKKMFELYIECIRLYEKSDGKDLLKNILKYDIPQKDYDKQKKCTNCFYRRRNKCNLAELQMQKGLYSQN